MKEIKIVIWCGNAANQKALANKIAAKFPVTGIVIESGVASIRKRKFREIPAIIIDRIRFRKIYQAWKNLMQFYEQGFREWPKTKICKVDNINSPETATFTKSLDPDLIIVSGTGLIREPLISLSVRIGIINLHTGVSPYVKGGPNCTNWCIANNEFHLVGNTIMWLNAGIDSGNIITTETIDVSEAKDLDEVHRKVMDHAHELYLRAISYLVTTQPPYNSVSQSSLGKGKLYLTKMWTAEKRKELLRNWSNRKKNRKQETIKTIPLPAHA